MFSVLQLAFLALSWGLLAGSSSVVELSVEPTVVADDIHLQCDGSVAGETHDGDDDHHVDCPRRLVVNWLRMPPYFYNVTATTNDNATLVQFAGVFHEMLYHLRTACRHFCQHNESNAASHVGEMTVEIKRRPIASYKELLLEIMLKSQDNNRDNVNETEIYFPLATPELRQSTFYGLPFLFTITSPGVVLIKRTQGDTLTSLVSTGIKNSWHMLMLVLLLAVIVGALIWLVEHPVNADFPPSFASGCWTGFWYAVVTMTTVGYGDKVPRSTIGRMIACVWMLVGLCLFPVLVANFTSALQSSTKSPSSVDGTTIAVIRAGPEIRCALDQNANVIEKSTYLEVLDSVSNWESQGALIEKHVMRSLLPELKSRGLRPQKTLACPINIGGVVVPPGNKTRKFALTMKALGRQCVSKECRDSLMTKELSEEYQVEKAILLREGSSSAQYDLQLLLLTCGILAVMIICTGIFWQKILSRQTRAKLRKGVKHFFSSARGKKGSSREKETITPADEVGQLKEEFNLFYGRFIERLANLERHTAKDSHEMTTM